MFSFTARSKPTILRLIVALGISLLSVTASAATFYVDPAGNDSNNGTSTASAWQSLAKVSNRAFSPGDTILFKRGGVWRGQLMFGYSGNATSPIVLDAYGTGNNPVIDGADVVGGWVTSGGSKYTASVATQPEVVVLNGVKGTRVSSASAVNGVNKWFWANSILTVYAAAAPANVEVATHQFTVAVASGSYVSIKNLAVIYAFYPVMLYNASHCLLENLNVFDSAGTAGIYLLAESPGVTAYNTVRNCTVYSMTGSTDVLPDNDGCGIYLYGENTDYNTVTGCTVHDVGMEGIVVQYGSYNTITGSTVYRSAESGFRVANETSAGNVIEKNLSYSNAQKADDRFGIDLIRVGNDNIVRYNVCHDQYKTLNDPNIPADPTNNGQKYGTGGIRFDGGNWAGNDYMDSTGNKAYYNVVYNEDTGMESFDFSNIALYNNTVYNSTQYGIALSSIFSVVCANNVVRNNIISGAGSALIYHYRMNNSVINNNVYYPDASGAFIWASPTVYIKTNFAGWKQASAQDANSLTGDPRFTNPASANFVLQSGSLCVDKACPLGITCDIAGTALPQGAAADMGSYELAAGGGGAAFVAMTSNAPATTNVSPIPVTVTFSQSVTGFLVDDITAANATVGAFAGSGASYSFSLTPSGQGTVTANIAAGAATNASGSANAAAAPFCRVYDGVAPVVSMTSTAPVVTSVSPIPVTVTFSESVTGFVASDITPSNATVSGFSGSGASYTFSLTPIAPGTVSASIGSGVAVDAAGNGSTAAAAFSRTYSSSTPTTVTLSSSTSGTTFTNPIPVSIVFSKPVTGFTASDIVVTNGSIAAFSGSGTSYTISVKPKAWSTMSVSIPANAATDSAGNGNTASSVLSRFYI